MKSTRKERKRTKNWPNVFFHEADQWIKSRLSFSLGSEGNKRFLQSHAHTDIANISFPDFYNQCEALFEREKSYIIERLNLYNTQQLDRESLETFFLRLSGQAAQCGWAIENEKEVVCDIFIAKMKFKDIQRDLCIRPGNSRKNAKVTASTLQKQMGLSARSSSNSNFGQSHPNSFKIKQEPTLSVQRKNSIQNRTNRPQNPRGKSNNRPNNTQQRETNHVTSAGRNSPRIIKFHVQQRMWCNKKGHFARCCNSRSNVGIVDDDSEITAEEGCDFIPSDSETEYSVLNKSPSVLKTSQGYKPENAFKKLEAI